MPISPSLRGLSQAVSGPPLTADDLTQQFDQGQQSRYAAEDADPNLNKGPGYPSSYSHTVNRIQDAGAVGPEGYNRSQLPFIQSVATRKVTGLGGPQDNPAAPQDGPFGQFGAGTGGNMPSALPPMAGLNMALANKNLKWSGR